MTFKFLTFLSLVSLFISCKVDPYIKPILPADKLEQVVPAGWPEPKYKFENNAITQDRFILGRALFYEPKMSKNDSVSCGSCHQSFAAFANLDHDLSHGISNAKGTRNSPGIFNLAWHPYFMHDGGVNHIEMQPLAPITNTLEMGENINHVMAKLKDSEKYRTLFTKAYGDADVDTERMFKAIAQFMGLMLSSESKYDKYKRHEVEFTTEETKGYDLFIQKCSSCHAEPLFTDFQFRNNGLSVDASLKDKGRFNITQLTEDMYKFKTPSLRNVALSKPYMHDGRYPTLEACLDHYTNGIKNFTNLDPKLNGGIALSPEEKKNIVFFLNTLSDFEFINDRRFADPNTQ